MQRHATWCNVVQPHLRVWKNEPTIAVFEITAVMR
jgi:hypothetical protein